MRTRGGGVSIELARKREQLAFELSATKGLTETQIADELAKQGLGQVTQQAVSKMLQRIEERMLKEMSARVKRMKVSQTAALQKVFRDAMAAWEESKRPQKSLTTKHGPSGENGEPGKVKESLSVLKDQDGDPRYLEQARQALADIRKIWGVDEPTQTKNDINGRLGLEIVEEIIDANDSQDSTTPSGAAGIPPE
jgi:hypothetical protein